MKRKLNSWGYHLLMALLCLFFVFPFYIMVTTMFKTSAECYTYPIRFLPKSFLNVAAFVQVFNTIPFFNYLKNTTIITVFNMLGVFLISPMAAYSLARLRWKFRNALFLLTLAVMMIPYQVIMIPIYMIFAHVRLTGTFLPLIVPSWLGTPFYIFLLRQFFRGMPKDLEDAGRIDGASELYIYSRIFLPLCKPAIVAVLVFELLNNWNDFTGPLIYLTDESMYTLQIGLSQFHTMTTVQVSPLMAASFLVCLPVLVLFFFAQKQFMQGITFTGIKG